ncbi:MAG TPA: DUF2304 domain-containing protein [Sphingomonadaceae bacterium]
MIAQVMLSAGLSACLFYVFSLGRSLPIVRWGLFAVVLVGYIFIWMPSLTTQIAELVGIGRGADLILYIWIILNLFLILRLHIKLREQSEALTKLARQLALSHESYSSDEP